MLKKILVFITPVIILFSCQKGIDNPGSTGTGTGNDNNDNGSGTGVTGSITGTYDFISADVKTKSIAEMDFEGTTSKTISYFDYVTINNKGTLVIDESTMASTGLTYTASGNMNSYIYEDGVLSDSMQIPLSVGIPESSSTVKYKLYNDSVYFPEGSFMTIADGTTVSSPPGGCKFKRFGDTLRFYENIYQDTIQNISGINNHMTQTATAVISYKKQQ